MMTAASGTTMFTANMPFNTRLGVAHGRQHVARLGTEAKGRNNEE